MQSAILAIIIASHLAAPTPQHPRDEMPVVTAMKERIAAAPSPQGAEAAVEPTPVEPGAIPEPWASLAECESHGEWDYNEHSGWGSGIYDGGLQFDPGTWLAFGGGDYAPTADRATPLQQIEVAERTLAAQGWVAWPACSLELGLR